MSTTQATNVNRPELLEGMIGNLAADVDKLEDTVSEVAIELHKLMEHQLDNEAIRELIAAEVTRQLQPLQGLIDEMQEQLDVMSGQIVAVRSDVKPVPKDYF